MTDIKIINDILSFLEENYLYVSCGIVFLTAFYSYLKYDMIILSSISRSLKKLTAGMNQLKGFDAENIKRLGRIFDGQKNKTLKGIWSTYNNDFKKMFNQKKCPDIRDYFSVTDVVTFPGSRKRMEIMPGVLIALGILGTFIGLAIALNKMSFNEETGVITDMEVLTKGGAYALAVSITAIFMSLLFQVLDRLKYQKTLKRLHCFYTAVESKIPLLNSSRSNAILVGKQQEQTETIWEAVKTMNDKFNEFSIDTLIPALTETYKESIEKFVKPAMESMSSVLAQMNEKIIESQNKSAQKLMEKFTDKFNEATEGEFKFFTKSLNEFSDTLDAAKSSFDGFLSDMMESLKNQVEVNTVAKSLLENYADRDAKMVETEEKFNTAISNMGDFIGNFGILIESNREMVEKISEQNKIAQQENSERLENVSAQVKVMNDELDYGLEGVIAKLTDTMSEAIGKMDETLDTTMERLEGNTRSLLDTMDEQVRNISLYSGELNTDLNELNNKLDTSVKEFGEHIHEGIIKTFDGFDKGLAEISTRLADITGEIKDSVDDLPGAITLLKEELSSGRGRE